MPEWSVILHGGCKPIGADKAEQNREGCGAALEKAVSILRGGASALDAVEGAIRVMEMDPVFNAGVGSVRNSDGELQTDAAIMDGDTLEIGAVAAAKRLLNPIAAARSLLNAKETLIAGEGVLKYLAPLGVGRFEKKHAEAQETAASCDTVGCVAIDRAGKIVAGVSTGGLEDKRPGRIGDSPLPGCGFYADSRIGGVCLSGDGEQISRVLVAGSAIWELEHGRSVQEAVDFALARLDRVGGEAGLIAIDRGGRIGWRHNGAQFAVAWADSADGAPRTEIAGGNF